MDFVKMEGLGNDFVVVDGPASITAAEVVRWCDRRFGIGADGVLEITPVDRGTIRMRYWNADGGMAEMCGNGLRCLASLAVTRGWVDGPALTVATDAGDLLAEVLRDGRVRALVGEPRSAGDPFLAGDVLVHPVAVGNPHAVVFVSDPAEAPVVTLGPEIERLARFPDRANVEFVAVTGPDAITMRIWERGVGETMASGTGATAAAFAAIHHQGVAAPVLVTLPGGDMVIEMVDGAAWMVGPATLVYEGRLSDPA